MPSHYVISGQQGSGINLVKNLLLLSTDTFWPLEVDRLQLVLQQYSPLLKKDKSSWLAGEMAMNIQVANNGFLLEFTRARCAELVDLPKSAVLINHSLLWDRPADLIESRNAIHTVFVMPSSSWGLEWQCRAAFEKCLFVRKNGLIESMYDYSFDGEDKHTQIHLYIQQHGFDQYVKSNVENMREVIRQQQYETQKFALANNFEIIYLEDLLLLPPAQLHQMLEMIFKIGIPYDSLKQVLETWRNLHWQLHTTFNWPHSVGMSNG